MNKPDPQIKNLLKNIAERDDKQAFAIFFEHYYTKLIQFALLFVPSYDMAEEVVSEVLVRLLRKRKELFHVDNFQGYLFQSVKNEALNQMKLQKRQQNIVKPIDDKDDHFLPNHANPFDELLEKELRVIVSKIVENLPPRRKMVYKLIKDEGMSYKEVASLLEISERTVEEHLKIAVLELRQGVTGYFEERKQKAELPYLKVAN